MYTEYSGIYVLVGIVFIVILTGLLINPRCIIESRRGFKMKDSTKRYVALAIAASTCVFLLHYTIPLLFKLIEWMFTQPFCVRASVASAIAGSGVFVLCMIIEWVHHE